MSRTTLTLDDDVAAGLAREMRASGRPFKVVVNEVLRSGLERARPPALPVFRVAARRLGLRPSIELDDVEGLLDRLDPADRR